MQQPQPIRISFIITSFGFGGAQMMLFKLLSQIDRKRFLPEVISLIGDRPGTNFLLERFQSIEIPLRVFNFSDFWALPFQMATLVRHLRGQRPHLVSTWMYHADLIGGLAARLAGNIPVTWNIRHSDLNRETDKRSTLWVAEICSRLSRYIPVKIICCAHRALDTHAAMGYDKDRMVIIPNGFDLEEFRPDPLSREGVRRDLGLDSDTLAIGMVGRLHPHKGHANFVKAAKILTSNYGRVCFILCGSGLTWENQEFVSLLQEMGLQKYFHLLGQRSDMPRLFTAFDVVTSASACEGFSNVVGEAMSCAVPCVVTDVGDSAWIVGNTGVVVPSESPEQLAEAWRSMALLGPSGRHRLGRLARQRIVENFSLSHIVNTYEEFFESLANVRG